jgi:hypothetical protein
MADLERHGYRPMRSSGSHGAVDVIGFGDAEIVLIQAKISSPTIPPAERRAVLGIARRMGPLAVPLSASRTPGGVAYRLLTGTGSKDWLPWEPEPTSEALCALETCAHAFASHGRGRCWSQQGCSCGGFVTRPLKSK